MKKTDLAYVAGIVDGDGSISLTRQYKRVYSYRVAVQVSNTNEWLLQWLRLAFGGNVHSFQDKGYLRWKHKAIHQWIITATGALDFLKLVYPYLRLKKPQAEIAIKFLEMRGQQKRWLKPDERVIAEAQRILMANLNKRGII